MVLSAFSNHCSTGVSLLIECSFDAFVNLVFANDRGRLIVADAAVKSFTFQVIAVLQD